MKPSANFAQKGQRDIGAMLDPLLVDQFALGTIMQNCRRNVTGPQSLHRLFASHHKVLDQILDDMANHAEAMGDYRTAALTKFLKLARMKTQPEQPTHASQSTAVLLAGHEAVLSRLRQCLQRRSEPRGDMPNQEFLNGMIGKHERMVEDLRAITEETNQQRANRQTKRFEAQQAMCDSV